MTTDRDRILLLEDDPSVSRLLLRVLGQAGLDVIAIDALDDLPVALEAGPFRAALIDVDLRAGGDGIEAACRLAAARPGTAILMMSGLPENLARAARSGFARGLAKPFTPAEVVSALGVR